ncbi:MAG TPA: iron ABC transporter permease [Spirochaetota bacterium]|nr:iron ABC transporter permease [Spirochaetota bacterium]HOD14298.1 iron ABC transporter permease [Spirochaetota bacterium]HPG49254.1 iron ABC transporter permease [Spirochaetota bacterium]HPN13660.1 iron ABC transporter permease [Spirochaetota bacterium]
MKTYCKILLLLAAGLVLVAASLSLGTRFIPPWDLAGIITGEPGSVDYTILVKLRLPRVLLAIVIGGALAVSGTVFQAVLKNPLADPYIIGVSGGAALGATAAIVTGAAPGIVAAAAFAGSIAVITIVYLFSKRMRVGSSALILSGIALGFILSAAVLLIYALSRSDQIHRAMLWLMGDLSGARYDMLNLLGCVSLALILAVMAYWKHLDVISMGDRFSRGLGVTDRDVRVLFWAASLLAALSVSLAGVIGFVGLIVPHMMRSVFGPGHLRLVPASAVCGGLFLLVSDTIGRSLTPPFEIPVGVITGFLGGAFFLVFMVRGRWAA